MYILQTPRIISRHHAEFWLIFIIPLHWNTEERLIDYSFNKQYKSTWLAYLNPGQKAAQLAELIWFAKNNKLSGHFWWIVN